MTTLLAVTGLSPAIVTETIWALAQENPPILPDRVIFLTTATGALKMSGRDWLWAWMGIGSMPTKFGLAPNAGTNPASNGANIPGGPIYFSSNHSGVINFSMADGSVRTLRPGSTGVRNPTTAGSDWYILQALAGAVDGVVIGSSGVTN